MKNNHLKTLLLGLALSVEASATTRLVLTGLDFTDEHGVFYLKSPVEKTYVKLDCRNLFNYLYSRSDAKEELNFDFYLDNSDCGYIAEEVYEFANPGNPVCLDIDFEEFGIMLYRKCDKPDDP